MNSDQFFSRFTDLARRYFWVVIGSGLLVVGLEILAASVSEYYRASREFSSLVGMGLASIALLVGGIFAFKGLRQVRLEKRLLREGVVAEGTLTSVTESNFRINSVYQWVITYRYQDYRGRAHEGQSGYLSPEEAATWRVGDTGTIRYDRRRPQDSLWGKAKKEAFHSEEQRDRTHSIELSAPQNHRVEKEAQLAEQSPPSLYQRAKQSPWTGGILQHSRLIGGILLFMSFMFVGLSVQERFYEAKGERVQGTVLGKAHTRGSISRYYVMYRFTTKQGQTLEGEDGEVLSDHWRTLEEGGPVAVEYLPSSPETNRIPGRWAQSSNWGIISGLLFLASTTLLLIGRRQASSRGRPGNA